VDIATRLWAQTISNSVDKPAIIVNNQNYLFWDEFNQKPMTPNKNLYILRCQGNEPSSRAIVFDKKGKIVSPPRIQQHFPSKAGGT